MTQSQPSEGMRSAAGAGAATAGVAAAVAATMASACCVPVAGPLIVALLGASGAAWAAGLKPYSPYLLAASLIMLAVGFWVVYRRRESCDIQARRAAGVGAKVALWIGLLLWCASTVINIVLD